MRRGLVAVLVALGSATGCGRPSSGQSPAARTLATAEGLDVERLRAMLLRRISREEGCAELLGDRVRRGRLLGVLLESRLPEVVLELAGQVPVGVRPLWTALGKGDPGALPRDQDESLLSAEERNELARLRRSTGESGRVVLEDLKAGWVIPDPLWASLERAGKWVVFRSSWSPQVRSIPREVPYIPVTWTGGSFTLRYWMRIREVPYGGHAMFGLRWWDTDPRRFTALGADFGIGGGGGSPQGMGSYDFNFRPLAQIPGGSYIHGPGSVEGRKGWWKWTLYEVTLRYDRAGHTLALQVRYPEWDGVDSGRSLAAEGPVRIFHEKTIDVAQLPPWRPPGEGQASNVVLTGLPVILDGEHPAQISEFEVSRVGAHGLSVDPARAASPASDLVRALHDDGPEALEAVRRLGRTLPERVLPSFRVAVGARLAREEAAGDREEAVRLVLDACRIARNVLRARPVEEGLHDAVRSFQTYARVLDGAREVLSRLPDAEQARRLLATMAQEDRVLMAPRLDLEELRRRVRYPEHVLMPPRAWTEPAPAEGPDPGPDRDPYHHPSLVRSEGDPDLGPPARLRLAFLRRLAGGESPELDGIESGMLSGDDRAILEFLTRSRPR